MKRIVLLFVMVLCPLFNCHADGGFNVCTMHECADGSGDLCTANNNDLLADCAESCSSCGGIKVTVEPNFAPNAEQSEEISGPVSLNQ